MGGGHAASEGGGPAGRGGISWKDVAWLMLSDIVGTSVLTFSGVSEKLGWVPTIIFLVGLFPVSLYVSVLMTRTRQLLVDSAVRRHPGSPPPSVGTMGDVARCAFTASNSGTVVEVLVYSYTWLGQSSYLLVLGKSVQQAFYTEPLCLPSAVALGIALIAIPAFSLRTLGDSVLICFINTVLIVAVVAISLVEIARDPKRGEAETHLVAPGLDFLGTLGAATNVVYAYAGQWMYFELMEAMEIPGEFPKAFVLTGPFMVSIYLVVACLGYALGAGASDLVASVRHGPMLRLVALLLFAHVAIVYLIKGVVLARYLHNLFSPSDVEARTAKSYLKHMVWCSGMLGLGFVVANAIPFFYQLLGLIGGFFAGPINFLMPIVLYLAALGRSVRDGGARAAGALCPPTVLHVAGEGLSADAGDSSTAASGSRPPSSGAAAAVAERDDVDLLGGQRPAAHHSTRREGDGYTAAAELAAFPAAEPRSMLWRAVGIAALGLRALPAWEVASILAITALILLTMVFGVADQIKEIIKLQNALGAPFSCQLLQASPER